MRATFIARASVVAALGAVLLLPAAFGCKSHEEKDARSDRNADARDLKVKGQDELQRGKAEEKYGDKMNDKALEGEGKQMQREGKADEKAANKLGD